MSADAADRGPEDRLRELGARLESPPAAVNELLALLDRTENFLLRVEQSPPQLMSDALRPMMSALVNKELLGHQDIDVKVAVAACISEITRITAPDAPYDDELMKDVFHRIVESFELLDDNSSRSYQKRVMILETVAKVRSCVVMLDLECDDLILQMFRHFLKKGSEHAENVLTNMETIMTLVIEESEEVSQNLASCLLQSVKKVDEEAVPQSFKLAEKVISNCPEKLKQAMVQLLAGTSVNDYSKVVTSLYQDNSYTVEGNDVNTSGKDMADDSKLSERTVSDELPQGSAKLDQDVSCAEEDGTSQNKSPGVVVSNDVAQVGNSEPVVGPASSKQKPELSCHGVQVKSTVVSKSDNSDMVVSVVPRPEKQFDIDSKKGHEANSSAQLTASTDRSRTDSDKEAPVASGRRKGHGKDASSAQTDDPSCWAELSDETKDGPSGRAELSDETKDGREEATNAENGTLDGVSGPPDSTPDPAKPRRGRPPKSHDKKTVGKSQTPKSEIASGTKGKPSRLSAKEGGKQRSLGKTAEGESSKKQHKSDTKQQKGELKSDEETADDISIKELVSPKYGTKSSGKSKHSLGESGGSKRKRDEETEEISRSKKSRGLDESLVGARIKVWWPDDKKYYDGIVESFDTASKKHKIVYDDSDVEILLLKKERWEFADGARKDTGKAKGVSSPDLGSETPQVGKSKTSSGKSQKELKVDILNSKESQSVKVGNVPKHKGRPKGSGSKASSSKDAEETLKTNKTKHAEETPNTNKTKYDSLKSGKKSKDSSDKKSKEESGSGGKDSETSKPTEETPRVGRKPNVSKTNGMSDKERMKESETSGKGNSGSGKGTTGKKRRRKSQS